MTNLKLLALFDALADVAQIQRDRQRGLLTEYLAHAAQREVRERLGTMLQRIDVQAGPLRAPFEVVE